MDEGENEIILYPKLKLFFCRKKTIEFANKSKNSPKP